MLQRSGKRLWSIYSIEAHQGWLNLTKLSKVWNQKFYLSSHSCVGDYSVVSFMLSAWWRWPSFEHPVQLEGLSQASRKHLYWCQPRVWICPLHSHFPAVWRKSHTWNSEDRRVRATGGCLAPWAPHWNSISSTAQHHWWRLVEWAGNFFFLNRGKDGVVERGGMDGGWTGPDSKVNMLLYTTHFK